MDLWINSRHFAQPFSVLVFQFACCCCCLDAMIVVILLETPTYSASLTHSPDLGSFEGIEVCPPPLRLSMTLENGDEHLNIGCFLSATSCIIISAVRQNDPYWFFRSSFLTIILRLQNRGILIVLV